jgi:hypothetical protein
MNNELIRIWKEAVVPQFEVPSRNLYRETKGNHENLRTLGVPAEIQARQLPNIGQKYCCLGQIGGCVVILILCVETIKTSLWVQKVFVIETVKRISKVSRWTYE